MKFRILIYQLRDVNTYIIKKKRKCDENSTIVKQISYDNEEFIS